MCLAIHIVRTFECVVAVVGLHLFVVQLRTYDFIGAPLCHCSNRQIAEPEIIEEGEVFRRRRYEESSEEEQSEEEDVDEEVRVVISGVR